MILICCRRETWRAEGVGGFFKGSPPMPPLSCQRHLRPAPNNKRRWACFAGWTAASARNIPVLIVQYQIFERIRLLLGIGAFA